jgi:GAF domain-containing protein
MNFPVQLVKRSRLADLQQREVGLERIIGEATGFVASLEQGDAHAPLAHADHPLLQALQHLQARLQQVADDEQARNWATEGLTQFANLMRQHNQDLTALGDAIVAHLVKYVGASQGALFLLETPAGAEEPGLRLQACYAYNRKKYLQRQFSLREGLAGQAVLERDTIYLAQVPANYLAIESGLGQARPAAVLIVPLKTNDEVVGVVELAAFQPFDQHQIKFVERLGESIAATVLAVQNAERTLHLLRESQDQGHELRQREEEMRQNMEELQATQEAARRAQEEASQGRNMLNSLINSTQDSIMVVGQDYKLIFVNDVVKKRYQNSDYSGIAVGAHILQTLAKGDPKVLAEWTEYYRRGLSGESLDFVTQSIIDDEQAFRHYFISPVVDEGQVIAAAVVSRDVTKQKTDEERIRTLLAEAQRQGQELMRSQINIIAVTDNSQETMLMVDRNYQVLIMNQALKRRYRGTGYEQMTEGTNVLEVMATASSPQVRDDWKNYYDRALRGDSFDMVLENVLDESRSTYRYYYLSPIVFNEQNVGVAVFSRDITSQRMAEREVDRLTQLLMEREGQLQQQAQELAALRLQLGQGERAAS